MDSLHTYVESLDALVKASGEALEGNCMYEHLSFRANPRLDSKRRNLFRAAQEATKICEIGVNAGHSALLLLAAPQLPTLPTSPTSTKSYLFFDLGEHKYTRMCAEYLQAMFTKPMEFVYGDSRLTIPQWLSAHQSEQGTFDLVHVDGGHTTECITSDLFGAYLLAKPGGRIIVDDINSPVILEATNVWVRAGLLALEPQFEATDLYPHVVLRKV